MVNAIALRPKGSDPPEILAEGIKDESAENRVAAIRQLADFQRGLDPWVPILLQLAEQDPDSSVRENSFGTLNQAFFQRAVTEAVIPVLTESLTSKNPMIRSEVVTYLTSFGHHAGGGIPKLLLILNEPVEDKVMSDQDGPSIFDSGCAAALLARQHLAECTGDEGGHHGARRSHAFRAALETGLGSGCAGPSRSGC